MKRLLACLFAVILFGSAFAAGQQKPATMHNGYWWKEKSDVYKEGFVTGYRDAVDHAATPKQQAELKGVGTQQLIDGMNGFYRDFRNVMILAEDAMTFVLDQARHVPDEKSELRLQRLREGAAGRGEE
jgi:hypothetical protein